MQFMLNQWINPEKADQLIVQQQLVAKIMSLLTFYLFCENHCQRPKFSSVVTQLLNNGQASRIFGMPMAAAMAMPVEVFLNRSESFPSLLEGAVVV